MTGVGDHRDRRPACRWTPASADPPLFVGPSTAPASRAPLGRRTSRFPRFQRRMNSTSTTARTST